MGRIRLREMGACPLGWPGCWSAREWGRAGPSNFGSVDQGVIKFSSFNLFNIYSLNTIRIQIQTSNDYSSQNKI
jgi:hypothetical protein